jgi:nucleotide-binding universal stress UspA family protein
MKILATFDGTRFSESTLPQLEMMSRLPTAEFILMSVGHLPKGSLQHPASPRPDAIGETVGTSPIVINAPDPEWAESRSQAVQRRRAELEEYLRGIATRLPKDTRIEFETDVSEHPAQSIVDCAGHRNVDVIVMATHSRAGILHVIFGSTAEQVVRSGVAPVLVVHPKPA